MSRIQRVIAALVLVIAASAISPVTPGNEVAATCGVFVNAKTFSQQITHFFSTVKMTASVGFDGCNHVKLLWATCTHSSTLGYSASVQWCSAYTPNGWSTSSRIDVGFNATVCGPVGSCSTVWSRRWANANGIIEAQRAGLN